MQSDVQGLAVDSTATTSAGVTTIARRTASGVTDLSSGPRAVIEQPTAADLAETGPLGDRTLGRPDAPLTVIEYASLTCPYCRAFHADVFPKVKAKYIDTGKVRWVLREFPIGRSSGTAWIVTRCAAESKHFELYEAYLREQPKWVSQEVRTDAIFAVAAEHGMSRQEFDSCLSNQSIEDGLHWVKERARTLGVSGTPTFFFGTTKVRGMLTFEETSEHIEAALGNRTVAAQTVQ